MLVSASIRSSGGRNPVGECPNQPFQLSFSKFLRVAFQGSRVTSDDGLILVREFDERFGLSGLIKEHLVDSRPGRNRQFPLSHRLRSSVYRRLAGYEDLNDAARLALEAAYRPARRTERPKRSPMSPTRGHGDLGLNRNGSRRMILPRRKVEIGKFRLRKLWNVFAERWRRR